MGVELYLLHDNERGEIVLPWDATPDRPASPHVCVSSLKWFWYDDRVREAARQAAVRGDLGVDGIIPATVLVDFATHGFRGLVSEFAALHPDFDAAARERAADAASLCSLLRDFEDGHVWSDDEAAVRAAERLTARLTGFRIVFEQIWAAANRGACGHFSI